MRLNGARAICQSLVDEGVSTIFGLPGGAIMPLYDVLPEFPQPQPHPGAPRAERRPHGRRLRPRSGGAAQVAGPAHRRRVLRHQRPGRDQPGDRHLQRPHGLGAAGGHHRQRAQQHDRHRRLSRSRHHRHHHPDHQAELLRPRRQGPAAGDPRGVPPGPHRPPGPGPRRRAQGRPADRHRLAGLSGQRSTCRATSPPSSPTCARSRKPRG